MPALSVTVIGGGSFGTTLANIAAGNGCATKLWLRDPTVAEGINSSHINERYMPGYVLNPKLVATTDLQEALLASELVVLSIPSSAALETIENIAPYITDGMGLVSTTKGVIDSSFKLMSSAISEAFPSNAIGVISGPNLAKEIAQKQLTATVIASQDEVLINSVQKCFANDYFRVYSSSDLYGVELGGTLKNIYAIIAGLAAARGMGENTRSMLITRSLAEMGRFAVSLGANPLTFIGLAGVGDLIVTCTSPLSRNYRVGFSLGKGETLEEAISQLGEVAEGVNTLKLIHKKAADLDVYMPLANCLYDVLFNGQSVDGAIKQLMTGGQNLDVDFVLPGNQ